MSVTIVETGLTTATDSTGRFRLLGAMPAVVHVGLRRLGFEPATRRVDVSRGVASLDIELAARAMALTGMTVQGDSTAPFLRAQQATSAMQSSDTTPDDVFLAGFVCRQLPKSPDPDPALSW